MDKINEYTNRLFTGDAIDILPKIPSGSVDLVCTDPPYNLGKNYGETIDWKEWHEYEEFTIKWLKECKRILKPNGSIYIFMGVRFISKLFLILEEMGFLLNGWITWHYTQGMGRKLGFSPRHEDILYFVMGKEYKFNIDSIRIPQKYYRKINNMSGANPGDVWQFSHVHYSNPEREKHPTQKPEAIIERIVLSSSDIGDIVLDPFVGSGTTARVASILKRKYIGIDINKSYIEMSNKRLMNEFIGFDSMDQRVERAPKDLPNLNEKRSKSLDLFSSD